MNDGIDKQFDIFGQIEQHEKSRLKQIVNYLIGNRMITMKTQLHKNCFQTVR